MIRTHIIPQSNNVQVTIPDDYIGKQLEVIVFAEEEEMQNGIESILKPGNISKFEGMLSSERANEFQKFAEQIRNEWERDI